MDNLNCNFPKITSYDFDGVFSTGNYILGENDIIITGRCIDERQVIYDFLYKLGYNKLPAIYFNPIMYKDRGDHSEQSRILSGEWKANVLSFLSHRYQITHYEDDPLQIEIINQLSVDNLTIIPVEKTVEY